MAEVGWCLVGMGVGVAEVGGVVGRGGGGGRKWGGGW